MRDFRHLNRSYRKCRLSNTIVLLFSTLRRMYMCAHTYTVYTCAQIILLCGILWRVHVCVNVCKSYIESSSVVIARRWRIESNRNSRRHIILILGSNTCMTRKEKKNVIQSKRYKHIVILARRFSFVFSRSKSKKKKLKSKKKTKMAVRRRIDVFEQKVKRR